MRWALRSDSKPGLGVVDQHVGVPDQERHGRQPRPGRPEQPPVAQQRRPARCPAAAPPPADGSGAPARAAGRPAGSPALTPALSQREREEPAPSPLWERAGVGPPFDHRSSAQNASVVSSGVRQFDHAMWLFTTTCGPFVASSPAASSPTIRAPTVWAAASCVQRGSRRPGARAGRSRQPWRCRRPAPPPSEPAGSRPRPAAPARPHSCRARRSRYRSWSAGAAPSRTIARLCSTSSVSSVKRGTVQRFGQRTASARTDTSPPAADRAGCRTLSRSGRDGCRRGCWRCGSTGPSSSDLETRVG